MYKRQNMAKGVMQSLIKHGKVIRGWLGVGIQDLTEDLAKEFGVAEIKGALVSDVAAGGPAGHTVVYCRAEGCPSRWYRPRHEPESR